ncbi:hypothetical protein AHF37_01097, partial [Paragonimus kellicotti]
CFAFSDLQGIKTNAKRDGDDWILNGSKVFITNGYLADVVIVVAVTDPTARSPAHGISLFIVEAGMPGFSKGRKLKKMGFKTIQHRLAEMKTDLCVSRAFVDQCLEMLNEGRLDSETASMAKYWVSDLFNKIAYQGVQLHGGWGHMWEFPVCKAYVDARLQPIYGGANEIMKELIARSIFKS